MAVKVMWKGQTWELPDLGFGPDYIYYSLNRHLLNIKYWYLNPLSTQWKEGLTRQPSVLYILSKVSFEGGAGQSFNKCSLPIILHHWEFVLSLASGFPILLPFLLSQSREKSEGKIVSDSRNLSQNERWNGSIRNGNGWDDDNG